MVKITNSSQSYNLYLYGLGTLFIMEYIVAVFLISMLIRLEFILGIIILSALFYLITRAIINCLYYFIPKEECFIENQSLVYRRILFRKILLKIVRIQPLEIKNIIDKGPKVPISNGNFLNFFHYIIIFYKPNQRILLELKNGKKYTIFTDINPYPNKNFLSDSYDDSKFLRNFNLLKELIKNEQEKILFDFNLDKIKNEYELVLEKRYKLILEKIIEEESFFIFKKKDEIIINGYKEAIENLEIFKNMNFEEMNFYVFYVNYLSKKEYENQKVLVGYNGIDGKEVTMLKLKEDLNEIRDSKNSFK